MESALSAKTNKLVQLVQVDNVLITGGYSHPDFTKYLYGQEHDK